MTSDIFKFDNYCLPLIIMNNVSQLLAPKWPLMSEILVSKLKLRILTNFKKRHCAPEIYSCFWPK